jgi:sulfite reductase alpha subunit-like flavoprotein
VILYATQTLTTEGYAQKLFKVAQYLPFEVSIHNMENCSVDKLLGTGKSTYLFVLTSTHGDGDIPQGG